MNKRTLQIATLFILFILIVVYGWNLFQKISHNRLVFVTNLYDYVPSEAKSVINFSRNYHLEEYFELDTTNIYLLEPIKEDVTYPLVIAQFDKGDDLMMMKATKEQEESIKSIFHQRIAPYHPPKIKKYEDAELMFYSLPNNDFVIATFYKGIFAISKDYMRIENFVANTSSASFFNSDDAQMNHYMQKTKENAAASFFTSSNSTTFALAYHKKDSVVLLDGEYFGKLQSDSLKLSYNEMNSLLRLDEHYTDSIYWGERNKIQVWINKLPE